ncbi:MAG: S8 family peptidase [Chloroherpetonaceae bacterium]|nr:S8 family peptidase [Chloroherpetonaceae bacterium]MDW8018503.1 S8 family peptidase [Chloroherpetonaceae bacterium]
MRVTQLVKFVLCSYGLFQASVGQAQPIEGTVQKSLLQKCSPALLNIWQRAKLNEPLKVAVELSRKSVRAYKPEELLSQRAIQRRQKMVKAGVLPSLITPEDLPFEPSDLEKLRQAGLKIRHCIKSLNLVSGEIASARLPELLRMEEVTHAEVLVPSKAAQRRKDIDDNEPIEALFLEKTLPSAVGREPEQPALSQLDYGQSLTQLALSRIPEVHRLGFTGQGVLIANFDAGFANLSHEAFRSLRVVARYDFVARSPELGAHSHGTATMGVLAGYQAGRLIGVAFNAHYALARTEDARSETPIEEDNWAAAAEWADSLGADIITSSLGYSVFDPPFPPYTWREMNGRTAISTRAAARAAQVGIVVVNSAGNGGTVALPANTLVAPADADTVIAVGAVNSQGVRAAFSSVGPTADGRIKPDVMAMGAGVLTVGAASPTSYGFVNGTSFSCPIVAGVAALLLSANPSLTPVEIRTALRETASLHRTPNREMGWGIVNALDALNRVRGIASVREHVAKPSQFKLEQNYPNPFNPSTTIVYELPYPCAVNLRVYDALGREVATLVSSMQQAGRYAVQFSATALPSGIYFYRLQADAFSETKKMLLQK